jgi:peptidoglycan/LPS O-acetylase OafA/YrhL
MIASGLLFRRLTFTLIFVIASAALLLLDATSNLVAGMGTTIVYYFFVGSLFFHWREKIPFSFWIFVTAICGAYILYVINATYVAPFFVAYATVYLGLIKFPRVPFLQSGDYSYGVYLYGFPIAQGLLAAFPILRGHGWAVLALTLPLTLAVAMASWHLIERPTLGLKRYFRVSKPLALAPSP